MSDFLDWLTVLMETGESVQREPPRLEASERPGVVRLLLHHYTMAELDLAGPPLPFQEALAVRAAEFLAECCWLVVRNSPEGPRIRLGEPSCAADHLAVDLCGRFWPAVYRRAFSRGEDDPLAQTLAKTLRAWPLAGVRAQLSQPPTASLDFFGHPGLQLLYAERLILAPQAAWLPSSGGSLQQVERVFAAADKALPVQPVLPLEDAP